jgi:pyridoxal phosphate enzyme (YggS family)
MTDETSEDRRSELEQRLGEVTERIADAARGAGRNPAQVTLIAVTKTWPDTDLRLLADLGVTDVAENKAQEFSAKAASCADVPVTWHFVGQLQRNKIKSVVPFADFVHSVDRASLVAALDSQVAQIGRPPLKCLVQVSLDVNDEPGRAGVQPGQARELADQIAGAKNLELAGVMGVAPRGGNAREAFELLSNVGAEIADDHNSATVISAGMSGDFATAIAAGATHVRLGSALLGERAGFVR